jgi:DNA-binding SARP family transcriptional activator/ATP/maltotriose-dependent transcriptional regulator MalT
VRAGRGLVLIERPRVTKRLAGARVALLEAPGGYGKSTAWTQWAAGLDVATVRVVLRGRLGLGGLLSALAQAFRRAGLPSLAEAIEAEDAEASLDRLTERLQAGDRHILLAVDEVHRAAPAAAAWLATLSGELPAGNRLVLAGRRIGPSLAALANGADGTLVAADELRFDRSEVAAVLSAIGGEPADTDEVEQILAATDGWPAAVTLAATRPQSETRRTLETASGEGALRALVNGMLAAADPATRALTASIADLPLLSAPTLAVLGGDGALDRLLDAGIPIRFRPDGWGELPEPVRELLPSQALTPVQARAVAELYARDGELAEAATLLHRAGDHEGVVGLLASQRRSALERAGLAFFDAILNDTPDETLARHPAALVLLVQAAERQPRLRRTWIARAAKVLPEDTPWRRAVDAERAYDIARAGDLDAATREADRVLASAGADERVTIGRAHLSRALCVLLQDTAGSTGDVGQELELAIGLFSLAGERSWEAEAHQAVGYGVYFTTGALELASERLERALALRPAPDAARAGTLSYVAEVLMSMGRLDDAAVALREASAIGRRLGDSRTVGYAAWSAAELYCQRRDRVAAFSALDEAEAHPEGWFEGLAGVDFLANAAEIRTVLGDESGARRDLLRAEQRAAGSARAGAPLGARARFETTYGDPQAALRHLDALDASPFVYRGDRWVRLLLRAVCAARLGDTRGAAELLQRSQAAATQDVGDPDRLARQEPELMAMVQPGKIGAGGNAPMTASVVLLGRFAVERDGADVSPPPGLPSTLVKLIALQRVVTTDEAIDALWPEADIDVGRARLRNLLNRVREASGELVVRHDAGALAFAPDVSVDAHRFEEDAAAALAAPPEARAGLARRALVRSTGELLPADRYADWAVVPRERLRRRHVALLDLVIDDAIARGDLDEADRLLDAAITSDPMEEVRYVQLGRALLTQGRTRQARRVAEQGAAMAEDLGVEPGEELAALLGQLGAATSLRAPV